MNNPKKMPHHPVPQIKEIKIIEEGVGVVGTGIPSTLARVAEYVRGLRRVNPSRKYQLIAIYDV